MTDKKKLPESGANSLHPGCLEGLTTASTSELELLGWVAREECSKYIYIFDDGLTSHGTAAVVPISRV